MVSVRHGGGASTKKHLVDQSISASMTEGAAMARAALTDDLPVLQTTVARRDRHD